MTRDALMTQLYFSENLRRGARSISQDSVLWEDLFSDAILKAFEKYSLEDLLAKKAAKTLDGLIFIIMKHAQTDVFKSNQRNRVVEISDALLLEAENGGSESIEISKEEKSEAEDLFGGVSALGVQLMRQIHKADTEKKKTRSLGKRRSWRNCTWSMVLIERFSPLLELVSSKYEVQLNFCPQQ